MSGFHGTQGLAQLVGTGGCLASAVNTFQPADDIVYFHSLDQRADSFKFPLQPPVKCTSVMMSFSTSTSILLLHVPCVL
jgi:hypothetical protein